MAGAPGGCWKGALPGAEGSFRRNWGRGENSRLALSSAVGIFFESFSGQAKAPSLRPPTAEGSEETSGNTKSITASRSHVPTPWQPGSQLLPGGGRRRRLRPPRGRGPPTAPRGPAPAPPPTRPPGLPASRPRTLLWAWGSPAPRWHFFLSTPLSTAGSGTSSFR